MFLEIEKIKQVAGYFANKIPDLYVTKFLKLMYYTDFISVLERGRSVSNDNYYHLPYGPIPSFIKDQVGILKDTFKKEEKDLFDMYNEGQDIISIFEGILELEENQGKGYRLKPVEKNIRMDSLSLYEQELLKDIVDEFKNEQVKNIVNKTHSESPYAQTSANDVIDYALAFYLNRNEILPKRTYSFNINISQAEFYNR